MGQKETRSNSAPLFLASRLTCGYTIIYVFAIVNRKFINYKLLSLLTIYVFAFCAKLEVIPIGTLERIFELVDQKYEEQRFFAADLGTTASIVSQWRRGKSASYNKYLPQIAAVLGTSVEYLMTGRTEPKVYQDFIAPDDLKILRQIHDRPGLRIMFDLSAKATDADIEKAVDILKAYYGVKEEQP